MLQSSLTVQSPKADRYMKSLANHFARKVQVDWDGELRATVHFPMGPCTIHSEGESLTFDCSAESEQALAAMQGVIDAHVKPRKDFRDAELDWQ